MPNTALTTELTSLVSIIRHKLDSFSEEEQKLIQRVRKIEDSYTVFFKEYLRTDSLSDVTEIKLHETRAQLLQHREMLPQYFARFIADDFKFDAESILDSDAIQIACYALLLDVLDEQQAPILCHLLTDHVGKLASLTEMDYNADITVWNKAGGCFDALVERPLFAMLWRVLLAERFKLPKLLSYDRSLMFSRTRCFDVDIYGLFQSTADKEVKERIEAYWFTTITDTTCMHVRAFIYEKYGHSIAAHYYLLAKAIPPSFIPLKLSIKYLCPKAGYGDKRDKFQASQDYSAAITKRADLYAALSRYAPGVGTKPADLKKLITAVTSSLSTQQANMFGRDGGLFTQYVGLWLFGLSDSSVLDKAPFYSSSNLLFLVEQLKQAHTLTILNDQQYEQLHNALFEQIECGHQDFFAYSISSSKFSLEKIRVFIAKCCETTDDVATQNAYLNTAARMIQNQVDNDTVSTTAPLALAKAICWFVVLNENEDKQRLISLRLRLQESLGALSYSGDTAITLDGEGLDILQPNITAIRYITEACAALRMVDESSEFTLSHERKNAKGQTKQPYKTVTNKMLNKHAGLMIDKLIELFSGPVLPNDLATQHVDDAFDCAERLQEERGLSLFSALFQAGARMSAKQYDKVSFLIRKDIRALLKKAEREATQAKLQDAHDRIHMLAQIVVKQGAQIHELREQLMEVKQGALLENTEVTPELPSIPGRQSGLFF